MAIFKKEVRQVANKKKASTNGEKHRVTIIMVGVPEAVMRVINLLHLIGLIKTGDWLEINHSEDNSELTVTIVIDFMP